MVRWLFAFVVLGTSIAIAQDPKQADPAEETDVPAAPEKVDVDPIAGDAEISGRLTRILKATGWFSEPGVQVDEGVVFLEGKVRQPEHKDWAGRLATNTQDVVAVVNRIEVIEPSMWDLSPAWGELRQLAREAVRNSPLFLVGILGVIATWFATKWTARGASRVLGKRLKSPLLSDVVSRAVALPVLLLGLYLIFRISGLTRLAATVLGGTGVAALVLGFAFRDIAENFLASILLSIQHPFARGDLIEVAGYKGFVQSINSRSALLMTLEGNYVQIPNATIYKETIVNFTANPKERFDFLVGIGYADSITKAQETAMGVLQDHPAVVADPESLVLVESLGAATVNLRVYFWVDIAKYSAFKVCSAVIRLTKLAFEEAGISMPDEAREMVFPQGVPVKMIAEDAQEKPSEKTPPARSDKKVTSQTGEGDLTSEAGNINEQARRSRVPEEGQDLLNE